MTHAIPRRLSSLTAGLTGLTWLFTLAPSQADDRLGPINITATREAPAIAPAMPETVITREEIERSQARSLEELLAGRPGLNVTNLGGPGKQSNVSIWGQSASRTAVFVDGIRIGLPSAGQSYLEHIPLAQIERIEIVRGPRSGQWGADAGGGVIQIFTRKGTADGTHLSGGMGAGSRGNREADAHLGGRQGAFDYSFGLSHRETDGFDSFEGSDPDDDGYRNQSAQGQIGYRFGDGGHIRGHFLGSEAETEFDSTFGPFGANEVEESSRAFGVSASTGQIGFWQLRARAGRSSADRDFYENRAILSARQPAYAYDDQRDTVFVANDFQVNEQHTITVGGDWSRDSAETSPDYLINDRINRALFLQVNSRLGERLDLQAAVRRDFNEQFGTANTGSLDLAYTLTSQWTLTAGHGTAFTAPSFDLLYAPFAGFSNPDLDAERTRTSRAGLQWQKGSWQAEFTAFRTNGRDLIRTGFEPVNIDRARIHGAEALATYTDANWSASASLTYLTTEDRTTGERLVRQPRWNGRVDVDRRLGRFDVGATLRGQSNSKSTGMQDNAGFVTADLRGAYRINTNWRVEARIDNLFDRDYQIEQGYNQAPRGVFVSLRYGR
ncbi:TonB-dependent receptor domain-containing protein [Guyparkeria sp. TX1]|uniref:TonB-dependent receptor domain-containing protein n=1 Tax=Guyparkeria sp. TX1 TaxID=3115001 RepID=UPI0039775A64